MLDPEARRGVVERLIAESYDALLERLLDNNRPSQDGTIIDEINTLTDQWSDTVRSAQHRAVRCVLKRLERRSADV